MGLRQIDPWLPSYPMTTCMEPERKPAKIQMFRCVLTFRRALFRLRRHCPPSDKHGERFENGLDERSVLPVSHNTYLRLSEIERRFDCASANPVNKLFFCSSEHGRIRGSGVTGNRQLNSQSKQQLFGQAGLWEISLPYEEREKLICNRKFWS